MDHLLALLKENARISLEDAARQLDSTPEEVAAAMDAFEKDGTIRAYQVVLDDDKAESNSVTAMIEVQVQPEREGGFDHIANRLAAYPEVSTMYLMSGQYDLLLFVEGTDLKTVAHFVSEKLSSLPGVTGTATHFKLKTYKHLGVLMEPSHETERLQVSP